MPERYLRDYWPPILRRSRPFAAVAAGQQDAVDGVWDAARSLLDEQFIESASDSSLSRWEEMLKLPRAPDIRARREAILSRLRESPPFTLQTLAEALRALAGGGEVEILMTSPFTLHAALPGHAPMDEAAAVLGRMLPANIQYGCGELAMPHRLLSASRHGELAAYTHQQIRKMRG